FRLSARRVLLVGIRFIASCLQGDTLLIAVSGGAYLVDGAMMHDGLQPAMHAAVLLLVGVCFAPEGEECFLYDIFGCHRVLQNAVCQGKGVAMIAFIEEFEGEFRAAADSGHQLFITKCLGFCAYSGFHLLQGVSHCHAPISHEGLWLKYECFWGLYCNGCHRLVPPFVRLPGRPRGSFLSARATARVARTILLYALVVSVLVLYCLSITGGLPHEYRRRY